MKTFLYALMTCVCLSNLAFAGELDNEQGTINQEQRNLSADLPSSVVVRVDSRDNSLAVLQSKDFISQDKAANVTSADFQAVKSTDRGELDQNSSTSGWYFYFNNHWNCPSYYYGGYNYYYQPYYAYTYGYYSYYYYWWNRY